MDALSSSGMDWQPDWKLIVNAQCLSFPVYNTDHVSIAGTYVWCHQSQSAQSSGENLERVPWSSLCKVLCHLQMQKTWYQG